jgi:hydrogenase maturation protease
VDRLSDGSARMRTLVIGLGNPLLSDDGIGIRVVRAFAAQVRGEGALRTPSRPQRTSVTQARPDHHLTIAEDTHGGLRLMERMIGFDRALIVDAIRTGAAPGTIFELGLGDLPSAHSGSSHDATLPLALQVGRQAGAVLPADEAIRLIAVEGQDMVSFAESCTPAVAAAVPRAVTKLQQVLWQGLPGSAVQRFAIDLAVP